MDQLRILIAGCGDVGSALGTALASEHTVYGLRRSIHHLPNSIIPIQADFNDPLSLMNLPDIDVLVYCAAPNRQINDSYEDTYINGFYHIINALKEKPKHVFFTSSTSVYSQCNDEWINEKSPTLANSNKAQIMLNAEQQVFNLSPAATVIRFSGIYGTNRLHMLKQARAGEVYEHSPTQYSNRIHIDDCAGALAHLIHQLAAGHKLAPIYLASDNTPAPIHEVMLWLFERTNQAKKNLILIKSTRKTGSKRCDNSLLLKSGYRFKHIDYKSGYTKIMADLSD